MAKLQKIKELASCQNITIESLAEACGMTPQALHKAIRNNSTKIETIECIARKLKVSPSYFFDDVARLNDMVCRLEQQVKNMQSLIDAQAQVIEVQRRMLGEK